MKRPQTMATDAKSGVTPKLRFPEFAGQPVREVLLQDVTAESTIRNGDKLRSESVMGVTKLDGIVPMQERLIGADISRYKLLRKDWFAYNPMRLNIGSIARSQNESDVLVSPDYVVFRCREEPQRAIAPEFLDHFRRSEQWEKFVTGSGLGSVRVRIYYEDIARLRVRLPCLAEQQKIAECLSTLDELIGAESKRLDALNAHKKGLMQQLFPREGETLPRLRFSVSQAKWRETELEKLCGSISSGRDRKDSEGDFDLYGSTGIIGKTKTPSLSGEHILVARVGANAGALTRANGTFGATDNTLAVCPLPSTNVDYVFYYLGSINVNRLIFGSGQPLITGSMLKSLRILLPTDLEQRKISACLSSIDELISSQSDKLKVLKTHKQGLMQQLFPTLSEAET